MRAGRAICFRLVLSGAVEFVTKVGAYVAKVTIAKSPTGRLYLRTRPDAVIANNLGEIIARRPRPLIPPTSGMMGRR